MVRHFANPKLGERCFVALLDLYLAKHLEFSVDSSDANIFYLSPLERYEEDKPWFYARAIGHNILKCMLKNMFREAGISTDGKSNHSLRTTAITHMIDAGLPEKVIMDHIGHHSLEGLKLTQEQLIVSGSKCQQL